jgi:phosphoglycolate phosphatase
MRWKTVLFDMDGTLLDTLDDLHLALDHALASQGLPPRTREECRHFVGNGIALLVERGCPAGTSPSVVDATFAEFNRWYKQHCADHTHPYDGICDLLADLSEAGVRTAVVSNKSDYAVAELAQTYFSGLLDCSMGVRDGIAKKPAPDMCEAVMARLGAGAETTCYVGDSEVDVATAANARLTPLICSWGFRTPAELAAAGAKAPLADVTALRRELLG